MTKSTLAILLAWPTPYPALTVYTYSMCQALERNGCYELDVQCTVKEWELAQALHTMQIVYVDEHDTVWLNSGHEHTLRQLMVDHADAV